VHDEVGAGVREDERIELIEELGDGRVGLGVAAG
jgi:hypothetical protein